MRRWRWYLSAISCMFLLTACSGRTEVTQLQQSENRTEAGVENSIVDASEGSTGVMVPETENHSLELAAAAGNMQAGSNADSRILIAYFTWADNTVVTDQEASLQSALSHYESMGDSDQYGADAISSASILAPGNAARMAEWIQQEVGGNLFSIVVQDPYPSDYDDCMNRAADEKAENARPALAEHVENFEDYDIIFLGFPNWWYTLPMPVLTFVEEYDFSGKTVVPFCTHGTGGLSATIRDLENALPDSANILDPIGVYRADILQAQPEIQEWLRELDFVD
ncbi:MAG: flavodoxin [Eubacteriales bacterium]|nr:flavodoxin [Eubacteriales bacterium]